MFNIGIFIIRLPLFLFLCKARIPLDNIKYNIIYICIEVVNITKMESFPSKKLLHTAEYYQIFKDYLDGF